MMDKINAAWDKLTPARRRKLYRIAVMVAALLAARGVVQAESIGDWLAVLGYALGVAAPAVADRKITE